MKNTLKLFQTEEFKTTIYLFLSGAVLGILAGIFSISPTNDLKLFSEALMENLNLTPASTSLEFFLAILRQNSQVILIVIGLGIIYKYLPPLLLAINSFFIGYILTLFLRIDAGSFIPGLISLIPHGIFEIPALILACTFATSLARLAVKNNFKGRIKAIWANRQIVGIIYLLLLIAAIMESTVSRLI